MGDGERTVEDVVGQVDREFAEDALERHAAFEAHKRGRSRMKAMASNREA